MRRPVSKLNFKQLNLAPEDKDTYKLSDGVMENTATKIKIGNNFKMPVLKSGYITKIVRPSFKFDNQEIKQKVADVYKNQRRGNGNYRLRRNNFLTEAPAPRGVYLDKVQLKTLDDIDQTIAIGDESLDAMFNIQVDDPQDTEWLALKAKRLAKGETEAQIAGNPPFNRGQRQKTERVNFATTGLKIKDKIELLQTAMMSNNAETVKEIKDVVTSLAVILGTQTDELTKNNLKVIKQVVERLNIPQNITKAGLSADDFPGGFCNKQQYSDNQGLILIALINKSKDPNKIVKNLTLEKGGMLGPVTLYNTFKQGMILDLNTAELLTKEQAEQRGYESGLAGLKTEEADPEGLAPTVVMDDQGDTSSTTTTQFLGEKEVL
jgi:hypothetical protein